MPSKDTVTTPVPRLVRSGEGHPQVDGTRTSDSSSLLLKTAYRAIARISDTFPGGGARWVDRLIFSVAGNALVPELILKWNARRLKSLRQIENVCVLCDLNIGDAIMAQAAVAAIRTFLPDARVDYVMKRSAACLVEGNPQITRVYGVYEGSPLPTRHDIDAVDEVLAENSYELVFNMCPFLSGKNLHFSTQSRVIGCGGVVVNVVRAQRMPLEVSHVMYRIYRTVYDLLAQLDAPARGDGFEGGRITLNSTAIERSRRFLRDAGLEGNSPRVLFNPDTSSVFTRIPVAMQARLLSGLCELPGQVLLGAGHTFAGIEKELLASLPPEKSKTVTVVPPSLPIDAYAALIDSCDVFITGDTGLVHIAAARKFGRDNGYTFRNQVAVLSVYAAQPARLYGYDSERPGFLASNQDAEAHTYETESSCRSIATVNKAYIACPSPDHFFRDLDIRGMVEDAMRILNEGRLRS